MGLSKTTKRQTIVKKMRALGYEGPFHGKKYDFMRKGTHTVNVPRAGAKDREVKVGRLTAMLREAGISLDQWNDA